MLAPAYSILCSSDKRIVRIEEEEEVQKAEAKDIENCSWTMLRSATADECYGTIGVGTSLLSLFRITNFMKIACL